ncbi:hypothetical protein M569_16134 [Genlisea aurea]|uniref:Uncharacterized protein n=1 Tax=Genlisea aurea TaxID=192259 RepID=S8BVN6_9LAMI|nr:hypothetical protein M569_16134 [Genlisea aurea]
MVPIVLAATVISGLAGAVIVKEVIDRLPMVGYGHVPRCPSCNGTGRITCICTRWSDGDFGCRTCSGSGRMPCTRCGGTGTGRPLPVQVSIRTPS